MLDPNVKGIFQLVAFLLFFLALDRMLGDRADQPIDELVVELWQESEIWRTKICKWAIPVSLLALGWVLVQIHQYGLDRAKSFDHRRLEAFVQMCRDELSGDWRTPLANLKIKVELLGVPADRIMWIPGYAENPARVLAEEFELRKKPMVGHLHSDTLLVRKLREERFEAELLYLWAVHQNTVPDPENLKPDVVGPWAFEWRFKIWMSGHCELRTQGRLLSVHQAKLDLDDSEARLRNAIAATERADRWKTTGTTRRSVSPKVMAPIEETTPIQPTPSLPNPVLKVGPTRAATRPVVLEPVTTRPVAPVRPNPDISAPSVGPVMTVAQIIPDANVLPKPDVAIINVLSEPATPTNVAVEVLSEPVTPESTSFSPALPLVKKKAPTKKRVRFASPLMQSVTQLRQSAISKFTKSRILANQKKQLIGDCPASQAIFDSFTEGVERSMALEVYTPTSRSGNVTENWLRREMKLATAGPMILDTTADNGADHRLAAMDVDPPPDQVSGPSSDMGEPMAVDDDDEVMLDGHAGENLEVEMEEVPEGPSASSAQSDHAAISSGGHVDSDTNVQGVSNNSGSLVLFGAQTEQHVQVPGASNQGPGFFQGWNPAALPPPVVHGYLGVSNGVSVYAPGIHPPPDNDIGDFFQGNEFENPAPSMGAQHWEVADAQHQLMQLVVASQQATDQAGEAGHEEIREEIHEEIAVAPQETAGQQAAPTSPPNPQAGHEQIHEEIREEIREEIAVAPQETADQQAGPTNPPNPPNPLGGFNFGAPNVPTISFGSSFEANGPAGGYAQPPPRLPQMGSRPKVPGVRSKARGARKNLLPTATSSEGSVETIVDEWGVTYVVLKRDVNLGHRDLKCIRTAYSHALKTVLANAELGKVSGDHWNDAMDIFPDDPQQKDSPYYTGNHATVTSDEANRAISLWMKEIHERFTGGTRPLIKKASSLHSFGAFINQFVGEARAKLRVRCETREFINPSRK